MTELFPFRPNWTDGVEVRTSHKTDVFTSRSGREQRRALRMTPRRTVTYSSVTVGDELVRFQRLMGTKSNQEFNMPDWSRFVRTHGIEQGASHFTVRELGVEWLSNDTTIAVVEGERILIATITMVEGYTVEVNQPIGQTFSPAAVVRPVFVGMLGGLTSVTNTSTVASVRVVFDVRPGSVANSEEMFTPFLLAGQEVFGFAWNWAETVTCDYQWDVEKVDFQRGVTTTYTPVDFGTVTQKATIVRQDDAIGSVLRFLERAKGRRAQFWFPSGTADITLMSDAASGATALVVEGSDLYDKFAGDPVYSGLAIHTTDGRRVFRKINSITLASGNSVLNLNSPLSFALPTALVAKISWLRPSRFASDDQSIEYLTDNVVQLQITTSSVVLAEDVQDYADPDGAGYWVMDNWGEQSQATLESLDYFVNVAMVYGDVESMGLDEFDDFINSETWTAIG